ncbi:MAG: GNAT family N-acetyltransferase [Vicinamibacterales bacterium]
MRVDVVTGRDGLDALRPDWNALLESSQAPSVFLTWEWVSTWWGVYGAGAQLYVLTVRDAAGQLVAIAPFQRRRQRGFGRDGRGHVCFIGDGGDVTPEYLNVIALTGSERAVARTLVEFLTQDPGVGAIELRPMPEHSPMLLALQVAFGSQSGVMDCTYDAACPMMQLPATPEAFVAGQSRNYRKKVGEYHRRAERDLGATLRRAGSVDDVRHDMRQLASLHQLRWGGRSGSFRSPEYLTFHEALAQTFFDRGWLRLFALESAGRPLAMTYCFAYAGRYSFYQSGRDPEFARYRVGLLLMHLVVQEAIRDGASVFDFLRGEEEYKFHWAKTTTRSLRVSYWKSVPGWLHGQFQEQWQRLRVPGGWR